MSSVAPTLSNQTPQSELIDRIKLVFIASIYSMLCFANLTLMLAEGISVWPHILVIPTAVVCAIGIDLTSRFSLDGLIANLIGAAGIAMAAYEFSLGNEYRILSASHLLAYMSVAVMVLRKSVSHYWWMTVLAILQLAIASALTIRPELGLAILIFLVLGLWTMAIFTLYRATKRFQSRTTPEVLSTSPINQDALHAVALPTIVHRRSFGIGMLQVGTSRSHWMKLTFGMLLISLASFIVAMLLFQTVPRINVGGGYRLPNGNDSETFGAFREAISGFSDEVSLGDMGPLLESVEPVMTVTFRDGEFDRQLTIDEYMKYFELEEIYFRGGTQEVYANSRWKSQSNQNATQVWRMSSLDDAVVTQEIHLHPVTGKRLFYAYPFGHSSFTKEYLDQYTRNDAVPNMEWVSNTSELLLGPNTKAYDVIKYELSFEKRVLKTQKQIDHVRLPPLNAAGPLARGSTKLYLTALLEFSPTRFPYTAQLAEELTQRCETQYGPQFTQEQLARFIERHLKTSNEYEYSLNQTVIDTSIDPVEDFLKNRKQGHCEYYASALTLLLRACGIPARMATGFKGGNVSEDGVEIEVQQRHAHAWVEAYLENGVFIVLDGTPYAREDSVASIEYNYGTFQNFGMQMKRFWTEQVMGVNFNSQRARFYSPMISSLQDFNETLQKQGLFEAIKQLPQSLENKSGNATGAIFLSILGVLLVVILCGVAVSKNFRNTLWGGFRRQARKAEMTKVQFFELYQKVLKQQGIVRTHQQTVTEFLSHTSNWLMARLSPEDLKHQLLIPQHITDAYLRVRFGKQELSSQESEQIYAELTELSHKLGALASSNGKP